MGIYCLSMETVYFKGEVSPCGWAKVPAYPLCGCSAPATPPQFAGQFPVEFCLVMFLCLKEYIISRICFTARGNPVKYTELDGRDSVWNIDEAKNN
jgi:hypothetical protein